MKLFYNIILLVSQPKISLQLYAELTELTNAKKIQLNSDLIECLAGLFRGKNEEQNLSNFTQPRDLGPNC